MAETHFNSLVIISPPMASINTDFYVHPTAIVDEGAVVGAGAKVWHFCHLLPGCEIGEGSNIGQNCVVFPKVKLGRNVKVQNNVSIYEGVLVEDDVFLGPSMVFTNVYNPRSTVNRKAEYRQTLVKRGTSIGANATIVCGITLGEFCFIGAGAVVLKDVPPYALIVGNPGRHVGYMSEHGQRLHFDPETKTATCPESGLQYIQNQDGIVSRRDV